jgi:hypothetical protein
MNDVTRSNPGRKAEVTSGKLYNISRSLEELHKRREKFSMEAKFWEADQDISLWTDLRKKLFWKHSIKFISRTHLHKTYRPKNLPYFNNPSPFHYQNSFPLLTNLGLWAVRIRS